MDFGCSPHREGGTLHLPSPTHPHSYRLEGAHFSHLQQLRRSLSRSPSKPSRFQLRTSDSPRSPLSPLGLARAFSPKPNKPTSPTATYPESPLGQAAPATKRFSLRRSAPFRSSPRARTTKSKSPRRPLGDSSDTGNASPFMARQAQGQENTPRRPSAESPECIETDQRPVNDRPIKFAFAQSRPDLSPAPPAKSSPLKRNDGLMNLSGGTGSSPTAKRRSVHGASSLGDFESIFDQTQTSRNSAEESPRVYNDNNSGLFSSPNAFANTPIRRTTSLRKSTLSQRVSSTPRPKPAYDGEFALPGAAASKTRNRMSLDSSLGSTTPSHTPFSKPTFDAGRMGLPQPSRGSFGSSQPHPLSYAHTPSSASSSVHGDTPMAPPRSSVFGFPQAAPAAPTQHFSRSLPIGIGRPQQSEESGASSQDLFDTPFKVEPTAPVAFSTGLLSKKNRNVDEPVPGAGIYVMPDTPSKRQSFPPAAADRSHNLDTPLVKRKGSLFGESARPQHQFGTPSTPFSANVSKFSMDNPVKRTSIFGNVGGSLQRRGSFLSIDGDDDTQPDNQSPTANRMTMTDSQSSAEDMPPTPTKPSGGSSRRSKESSLRRKTFRSRPSIGTDTFAAPDNDSRPTSEYTPKPVKSRVHDRDDSSGDEESHPATCESPSAHALSFPRTRLLRHSKKFGRPLPSRRTLHPTSHPYNEENDTKTSAAAGATFGTPSPQTPSESFAALDASRLSISGHRRDSHPFAQSLNALPPATPTTPREHNFFHSVQGVMPIGLTKNDVDESLAERFHEVKQLDGGEGEFSTVYRVTKPVKVSPGKSPAGSQVWVVKKSKKEYLGAGDRSRKMREVEVLYALRGNDHVLDINSHWEANSHLYIQTEYCEGGNLRRYLDNVGFNSRLDDFRIWKILLELSMGVTFIHNSGYIHLDLKPANILIDFEGGLKIADFGLASPWPAPKGIDGEGDRHYLAPEALTGRFDKPADVFALGMMLAEIAGNCVIPENGTYWQKLRSGEFDSVLPSLTWSADSGTLDRDSHGDPFTEESKASMDMFLMSDTDNDSLSSLKVRPGSSHDEELARAPKFMTERYDINSMDNVVKAMLHQDPDQRPTAEQVLNCFGCQWVQSRRRSGATVYEGNFGPTDDVLATYSGEVHYDLDADMMDMS
ncbi:kinase-like protein [Setomelanomma holmii]|uniref:Kinase-like protein n=1 Tax=Setomelanomma holmii TaxID=210430 RepID=A0A9P4H8X0_9PLEO|nr:kinase-like protein [Setomelanomma holmii]